MNEMYRRIALFAAPLLLAGCGGIGGSGNAADVAASDGSAPLAGARIGGPFSLTDQAGHVVTDRSFAGQYRIMYFGYTSCPDVCPTDAQNIGQGLRLFEQADAAKAAHVTPVFVSVDPQRDTPAVLRQFVSSFHPRMVGLTGSLDAIRAVAREYAVHFSTEPEAGGQAANRPGSGGDRQGLASDGPGLGGGYRNGDAPNASGGQPRGRTDGPGAGGGYRQGGDGPGLGGGYRGEGPGNGGGYLVSHTRVAYLMGPDGQPIALIPEDEGPQAVAAALARWVL